MRCLLVPSVMTLLGTANWRFPLALDRWIPNFSIEGEQWFRERERAAAAAAAPPGERGAQPIPTAPSDRSVPKPP